MNHIFTLLLLLPHRWLAVFFVSWVNSLLGMAAQGLRSNGIMAGIGPEAVSAYAVLLAIPFMNKHRRAYTLPHTVWLG